MESVWPEGRRAAVSLSLDDGRDSQLELAVPLLQRYRLKATFYLTTHSFDKLAPEEQREVVKPWRDVLESGHEIGNHTRTHPCTANFPWTVELRTTPLEAMSLDQMAVEIDVAQRAFEQALGTVPSTFAYPCGHTFVGRGASCASYVPLVADRFVVGRTYNDECAAAPLRCDLARLPGTRLDNKTVDELRELIGEAVRQGDWLVLVGHAVVPTSQPYATEVAVLDWLLRHLRQQDAEIWVDTVDRVGRHVRTLQESGAQSATS